MPVVTKLSSDHRELEALAATLLQIVDGPAPDAAAVSGLRWRMYRALADHCGFEDRHIYDALLASGDAAASGLALAARRELGGVIHEFRSYLAEWPVERIGGEWQAFGAATHALLDRLAERARRGEELLYPAARRLQRKAD